MPPRRSKAAPTLKEVVVLAGPVAKTDPIGLGEAEGPPAEPGDWTGRADGLPQEPPEGALRVFAQGNVLGLVYGHWGDVSVDDRSLEACLRKGLVMLVDPTDGQPKYAKLPPRTCCGNHATPDQH